MNCLRCCCFGILDYPRGTWVAPSIQFPLSKVDLKTVMLPPRPTPAGGPKKEEEEGEEDVEDYEEEEEVDGEGDEE